MKTLVLDVVGGVNVGAEVDLGSFAEIDGQGLTVGGGDGNAVVLADQDLAEQHARIERNETGHIFVTALAPGVRLGRRDVAVGQRARWQASAPLAIGSARIARRPEPAPTVAPLRLGIQVGLAACLIGIVSAVSFYAASGMRGGTTAAIPIASAATFATPVVPHALLAQTATLLQQNGLAKDISLSADSGAIIASGTILPAAAASWSKVQTAFDQLTQGSGLLVNRVAVNNGQQPLIKIGAVSMYPIPYLITASGQRLTEGAVLSGGWEITGISTREVTLRQGDHVTHIAL